MQTTEWFEKTLGQVDTSVRRDLANNFQKLLDGGVLTAKEATSLVVACSTSVEFSELTQWGVELMKALDFTAEQIQEAKESAAIMAMNNIYYRFRHMVKTGQGAEHAENYKMAGLRMTSLAKPILGKVEFEMLAFAISCLNGCEMCINAHEVELRKHNIETQKIHDVARLAAVIKGLKALEVSKG